MKFLILFLTMLFAFAVQSISWVTESPPELIFLVQNIGYPDDSKAEIITTSAGGLAKQKSLSIITNSYKSRVIETKTGLKPIDSYFRLCS